MSNLTQNNKLFGTSSNAMKLNESLSEGGRYIMEGIFAELGVMNQNKRVYEESEYLKHLQYLREDVKKGDLLGELDHPEDRYEVKLKEASHRITDIWYEPQSKMVMGKIEILNTPNGMIARSLVDMGIPLHISSRASGSINKDNTVSLQQIYTYDLVAKPGFAKATLHRVNESESANKYSDIAMDFLKHSEESEERNRIVSDLLNEGFYTDDLKINTKLRKEASDILENKNCEIDMDELTKHINESDGIEQQEDKSAESAAAAGIPVADMTLEGDESKEEKDTEKSSDEESEKKSDEKDDEKEEKSEDYEIIDVKVYEEPDENKEDEEGDEKTDDEDDKEEEDEKSEEESDEDEASESKEEKKPSASNMIFDKKNELDERAKKFDECFDKMISKLKTKKSVEESVKNELFVSFPFTRFMTESSIAEFSKLSENKKRKVRDYLCESSVVNANDIENTWRNGLQENITSEPIWLARASKEYRELYYAAPEAKKTELNECAKYICFNTQADVDTFWMNSELKSMKERQMIMESFQNINPNIAVHESRNELPYSMENIMRNIALLD